MTFTLNWANPDPDAAPLTLQQLKDILATLTSIEVSDDFTPYIKGSATPAVDDQDKVWHRLDNAGRPGGSYIFYNGMWVREAPSQGALVGYFIGDPVPWFDSTGLGLPGAGPVALDFFGWALMNGSNGTANWSDKFVILGRMDNVDITGYEPGGWRTNVNGVPELTGGGTDTTLIPANLPELLVSKYDATGAVLDVSGDLYGVGSTVSLYGDAAPEGISTVPPFVVAAMIQYIGY